MPRIYFVLVFICSYLGGGTFGQEYPINNISIAVSNNSTLLTCPLTIPIDQQASWHFNSTYPLMSMNIKNGTRFLIETAGKSLTIHNVTAADAGTWYCQYHNNVSTINLVVLDFDNILSFVPRSGNDSDQIIVSSKGDFSITAHYFNRSNVEFVNEKKYRTEYKNVFCKNEKFHGTTYGMKNATLENSGKLTIIISTERLVEEYLLNIFIHGKAILSMESEWSPEKIRIKCQGIAYPSPLFDFRFIPADTKHTITSKLIWFETITTSNLSTNVSATGVIKLPLPEAGTVVCTALNSEGKSNVYLFLENKSDRIDTSRTQGISTELLQKSSSMATMFTGILFYTIIGPLVALIKS